MLLTKDLGAFIETPLQRAANVRILQVIIQKMHLNVHNSFVISHFRYFFRPKSNQKASTDEYFLDLNGLFFKARFQKRVTKHRQQNH